MNSISRISHPSGRDPYTENYVIVDGTLQSVITALSYQALSISDLELLFQQTVHRVAHVLQVASVSIWRVLSDRHGLRQVASNLDSPDGEQEITLAANPYLRCLVQTNDARDEHTAAAGAFLGEDDSRFYIPIPGQDEVLGVLRVHSTEPREFSADEAYFLQSVTHILSTTIERQRSERLIKTQSHVLEQVANGANLFEVFNSLCTLLEEQLPGAYSSILIVDKATRQLRAGAAPTLPPDFAKGVDGLLIGECAGSCGTAAYRGEAVFVTDIATDPLWEPFREFALGHGIHACWSSPFLSKEGEVLGTFALSHRVACHPTLYHRQILQTAIHLASIAMESYRAAEALQRINSELEQKVRERTAELKTTLDHLQKTQAQLIQAEKMSSIGQMVAGIAHEINNPMSFIAGNIRHVDEYCQDLLELMTVYQEEYSHKTPKVAALIQDMDLEFIANDLPKVLNSIQSGSDRITNIVLGLKNFSRLDEAEMKPVDLQEGIENTLMLLNHKLIAQPNRPAIEVKQHYQELPLISCYANQLNQVFMNILSNAIDALEDQHQSPQIEIQTTIEEDNRVQIRISDNGSGIPLDLQPRIFDPFFTTKEVGKGTGLGLSISYQIVTEKHGGTLSCYSQPGHGTEFIIEIPVPAE